MSLADKVVVLDYGRKIAEGKPEEVRARPRRGGRLSGERRLMALEVTDLVAGYGDITVLRGVTCTVRPTALPPCSAPMVRERPPR